MKAIDRFGGIKEFVDKLSSEMVFCTPFQRKALRCIIGCIDDAYCRGENLEQKAIIYHRVIEKAYVFLLSYNKHKNCPAINTALAISKMAYEYGKKMRLMQTKR